MISSRRVSACGFSILAMIRARPAATFLTSATSSGRCTKETAIQSAPAASAASRSPRSFSVMAATGITVSGRETPLRFEMRPPTSTRVTARPSDTSVTVSRSLPSSMITQWPGSRADRISGWGRNTRETSPGVGSLSRTKVAPFLRIAAPSAKAATRSFGPCRSTRIAMGCFSSRSMVRMTSIFSGSFSRGRWLMLSRNTSAPARNSVSIISGVSEAGPRVAMIFVRRERFTVVSMPESKPRRFQTPDVRQAARSTAGPDASSAAVPDHAAK